MVDIEKRLNFWWVKKLDIKTAVLSLFLLLSQPDFLCWKNNQWLFGFDKIEQNDESIERTIENYKEEVKNRDIDIQKNTTEKTLEKYLSRMKSQFEFETTKNNSIIERINEIKNILNTKYSQNITSDDAFSILKSAFKLLSNTEKYRWLWFYSDEISGFDIDFVNALWYIQYVNELSCNRNLSYWWTTTLDNLIWDLNNLPTVNFSNQQNINPRQNDSWSWNNLWQIGWEVVTEDDVLDNEIWSSNDSPIILPDENVVWSNNNPPLIQPNENTMQGIQMLSNNLSSDKLNWVTYEEVWNTINSIEHEWLRNAVMNCFLHNDVIWAQRLLWMEINCNKTKYPNYVASTKIWHRELNLMEEYGQIRRLMDPQEILDYLSSREAKFCADKNVENFTYEVKTIYQKFLSWEISNKWLPYCIISKYDYKMYLFSADHKLISCHSVLTWADKWNEQNNLDPRVNSQTTPWWIYTIRWPYEKSDLWKNFRPTYWSDYFTLYPENWQYVYSRKYTIWMHGYLKSREWRMTSERYEDHRVSNWCINCDRASFWELINHFKEWSVVYVCRDDEPNNARDLWYEPENNIEMINCFGRTAVWDIIWLDDAQYTYCPNNKWNSNVLSHKLYAHNRILNKSSQLPERYELNMITSKSKSSLGKVLALNNQKFQGRYVA